MHIGLDFVHMAVKTINRCHMVGIHDHHIDGGAGDIVRVDVAGRKMACLAGAFRPGAAGKPVMLGLDPGPVGCLVAA